MNDSEEIRLQPTDPAADAARRRSRAASTVDGELGAGDARPAGEPPQYSLKQLWITITLVAVALATAQAFAPSIVAGTLGITMLGFGIALLIQRPENPNYARAWVLILVMYLVVSLIAVVRA